MKIKNLAFFGIMAAIMGVAGTARADTTTVIASQAYVDAKDALKQDKANRIQTTKSEYDGLNKSPDQKKEDYPSMFTLENSITAIGSDNFADKNLSNLNQAGTAVITNAVTSGAAGGNYSNTTSGLTATTIQNAIDEVEGRVDTAETNIGTNTTNIETNATNIATINTTLQGKQGNLGGGTNDGKVVTATADAGRVTYTGIDTTVGEHADNLVTSGAVATAIGNASSAVNSAYADNALDASGLAASSELAKMEAIQDTVARQGTFDKAWSDEFNSTDIGDSGATNLYAASNNSNAGSDMDNYVPTVKAVEKRLNGATTSDLAKLHGISATDTEINQLHSSGVTTADLTKLHGVTADASELNILDGVTATTTEINKLSGLTADTTELNYVDGVTSNIQTQLDAKQGTIADGSVSATNGFVKSVTQTSGSVGGTTALGVYVSDMNNALKGVSSNSTADCTKGSPCTLTYYKDGTNEYMRWTPMDTESTDADTTAADRSNA